MAQGEGGPGRMDWLGRMHRCILVLRASHHTIFWVLSCSALTTIHVNFNPILKNAVQKIEDLLLIGSSNPTFSSALLPHTHQKQ